MTHRRHALVLLLLATSTIGLQVGCSGGSCACTPAPEGQRQDIAEALRNSPGVGNVQEKAVALAGARFFTFTYTQPVDHQATSGATFPQKVTLLFRSYDAPMVLATTGYSISSNPTQGEPTSLLNANQLTLEHRFFADSTPSPVDWTKLSIAQAAADQHRLTLLFKPLFKQKWLNTGGSKGGMTAIFHRRFYPTDVDATVAYVAPISFGNPDPRYVPFLDARGTPGNRKAIEAWQQAMLDRRAELKALLEADAASKGETLKLLGSDKLLEFAILEAPFTLWQYGDASLAARVPAPTASAQSLYQYLDQTSFGVVGAWGDSTLTYYAAYYQQCANQLGYPEVKTSHLKGLQYPGQDVPAAYPPFGASKTYDGGQAMRDVQDWMTRGAERVLLIYGENDPWSAGAFQVDASRDNRSFTVPAGNHGARISQLPSSQKAEAQALLARWMGVPVAPLPALRADAPVDPDATFVTPPRQRVHRQ